MIKTVAYITDIHLDESFVLKNGVDPRHNWTRIIDDVRKRNIETIIYGGDIGETLVHNWFFDSLQAFDLQITLGNHDLFREVITHYKPAIIKANEWYFAEDTAHFHFIFLDSSSNHISPDQLQWLVNELKTTKPVVLFIHHPILSVETAVDKAYPLENRSQLLQALQEYTAGVTIFCGHYHMPDERKLGTIQQYVTPAASYQIVKESDTIEIATDSYGYRLIHFDDQHITTEVIWLTDKEQ